MHAYVHIVQMVHIVHIVRIVHGCMRVQMYNAMQACVYACMHVYVDTTYVYIHVYTCACVYICI